MSALGSAFALVFLAELGDKSMLIVLAAATRVGARVLLAAIAVSAALLMAAAVVVGGAAGELLPRRLAEVGSALVFIAVGAWTLRGSLDEASGDAGATGAGALLARIAERRSRLLVGVAMVGTLVLAELGDKTQLAAVSLASVDPGTGVLVWAGATTGMITADALAVIAGARLAQTLPVTLQERAAGSLFLVVGLALLGLAVL